ncbi:medium-chain-fatty-acid--CoA ligase AlkK [Cupriavidus necator N-1]|jgi:fatty-acyl-CoA synthase|uniref:Medium-chain-fatty-acid--CoA ligase AlkK n=1 Tax=Cupriavidus necator (strain ATCC 43291 / DSM 13513 / CCUG 52238 / LMG 8453 / N-1) TaxID=1042878 RepID=G0EX00_CUPNN|nr:MULTISPECIES: fatty acid--CoA ligase [Cupriavidus]AEI77173.1 medium-chain-fatty-acid--CoA ligase AlkK [Cupriavidus necator N-1]KAI3607206.1 Medium-chain-fatty-acid--CoA ligase [Cupriavidus necator H850]MDX6014272.1 fatty acid--CoA ligase [Cupriavidus necator]QUN26693.1 fatty acid--CoA ligase [Cupriavidus sp. KK10]
MQDNLITAAQSAYAYPLLVKQLLINSVSLYGDQEISYRGQMRYTFRDFRGRIGQLASALTALGAGHGTTVAVMDWDSHRYLECYFGVPMMGATLFTVNVRLSPQQILYTLNDAGADVVLFHADFAPVLEQIRGELTCNPRFVLMADGQDAPALTLPLAGEYEALLDDASPDFEFRDFDENTKAATFYTTGTTGDPKGVCYSHREIVLHTLASATSLCSPREGQRMHREDVYMPITPMFHVLAWGIPYIAMMLGLRTVLPGRYAPDALLKLRETEKVTFSHCVPTILQMLLQSAQGSAQDLSGWKIIIGGSALPPALCEAALARGIDIFAGYGMSETGPIVSLAQIPPGCTPRDRAEEVRMRCSTGRPVTLVDYRIVSEDMQDLPRDGKSRGEIVLRAPFLTKGYFGKPQASEDLWSGGFLHTQDVAVMGEDGFVQIVDRIKDVIKTGGEWVSSIEVENLITEVPGVQECAVIGVPDAKWGERPMAFVVRKAGAEVKAEQIRDQLMAHADSRRISKYAVPEAERITFIEAIPKTSVGKINKKQLREDAA